jgi:hypothetical protein
VKLGTRELLAAVEGNADCGVVRVVVCGLLEAGRVSAARRVLAAARFRSPGDGELAALWERVKFETARLGQWKRARGERREKANPRYAQEAQFATEGDRVILPFLRLADDSDPARDGRGTSGPIGGTVRRDAASFPRPHLARLGLRKADR